MGTIRVTARMSAVNGGISRADQKNMVARAHQLNRADIAEGHFSQVFFIGINSLIVLGVVA